MRRDHAEEELTAEAVFHAELADAVVLDPATQRELAIKAKAGDNEAKAALVYHNTRLVMQLARSYLGNGLDYLDLVQEGRLGILRAIEKFDPDRGVQFNTYAGWWIRQAMIRAIEEQGRTIRLPSYRYGQLTKLHREAFRLAQEAGTTPTTRELAEALGWDLEAVELLWGFGQRPLSLYELTRPDEDGVLQSRTEPHGWPADDAPGPETEALSQISREELEALMARVLTEREQTIVRLRFGFDPRGEHSLTEIGQRLGVSRQQIGNSLARALRKLRLALKHPPASWIRQIEGAA